MAELCERCGKRPVWAVHHRDGDHNNNEPENLWNLCGYCHARLENREPHLSEVKILYETVKDLERTRIAMDNRVRDYEGQWHVDATLLRKQLGMIKKMEAKAGQKLIKTAEEYEIFEWLTKIRGIAGKSSAQLIALIGDIGRFDKVSSLWHYAGLHVDQKGKAPKLKKDEKANYNPKLKTLCLGIIGKNLLRKDLPYRKFYDEMRRYYKRNRDWSKGHIHQASIRYMVKQFVKHLWLKWREVEGLQISKPHPDDGIFFERTTADM